MTQPQKRALAVHDISCLGKCSLTAALPILSAAGIECVCLPTAVLSTHTGIAGYTLRDLTDELMPIAAHWKRLDLRFDAIYTGYLASQEQIDLVLRLFDMFSESGTLRLVDPVMADHGTLYSGFEPDFPQQMRRLCAAADVIVPNLTEAALLLGQPYREGVLERSYIEDTLAALAALGPDRVVLTGVRPDAWRLGAASWDNGKIEYAFSERVDGQYPGSGDAWASAFLSALLSGRSVGAACRVACDFTAEAVALTGEAPPDRRYGLRFESVLPQLIQSLR